VAGKTFRGVGEDEAPSVRIDEDDSRPRLIDEDDARGLHSGPTVVDDQKVAEVLKKLRSLDRPPGPLTGVTEVVVDANSSEPTRLDSQPIQIDTGPAVNLAGVAAKEADSGPAGLEDVMYPLKRATAVGRSASTPADAQSVTVSPDVARGTMFGHSIHLPDVNAPDAADIELSSGAVQFLDGAPSGPQPFPLADRPAVVVPPPTSAPAARFHTPFDVDSHTQLVDPPRAKTLKRLLAFVGGLSIAGAGLWAWWQYGGGHAASNNPPPAAAPVATPPSIDPMPPSAATAPAAPAAAVAPAPTPAAPAAAAPTPDPAPTPATRPAAAPEVAAPAPAVPADEPHPPAPKRAHTRHSAASHERHAAAKPAPPPPDDAEPAASSKPGRAHKGAADIEDPDATMAPSD
jgi:hypothetical protein